MLPGMHVPHGAVQPSVHIRQVMAANLAAEVALIRAFLSHHPFVAVDTEFPGTVRHPDKPYCLLTAPERYALVKANVDRLAIIQLGLTLCDANGRFPVLPGPHGRPVTLAWQFNFRDFDVRRDPHNPESIKFLKSEGVKFDDMRAYGVSSVEFLQALSYSGILWQCPTLTWITFDGLNDFAYLLKVLTGGKPLPDTMGGFFSLLRSYIGDEVYDVKYMARQCPMDLLGGLKRVAGLLGLPPLLPKAHQAGPDSLLTSRTFMAMRWRFFQNDGGAAHAGRLDRLQ